MNIEQNLLQFDETTRKNLEFWLGTGFDASTRCDVENMIQNHPKEAENAFYTNLKFGTAGLRGIMGIGSNRMNDYTVRATTQGLANYLKITEKNPSVFISFDSRLNSKRFAEETAKVFAGNGIKVYLTEELRPTSYVSFGLRHFHCTAGVMITASHNPPEYNGYKVYWKDGGQVLPPHDKGIVSETEKIQDYALIKQIDTFNTPLITMTGKELDKLYLENCMSLQFYPKENKAQGCNLHVVYSSLHGTGITLVPRLLSNCGFTRLTLVEAQCIPDGTFPTVNFPNPEVKKTMETGIELLNSVKGDIFIATDPDADRIGLAVRTGDRVHRLTGNEMAAIALDHICKALTSQNRMPENAGFVKSIVTTDLLIAIARSYGKGYHETLTGFKYIAELIHKWEREPDGNRFIFGCEESSGFLLGTFTRDKDAVIGASLFCEIALHAKREGKTLIDLLYDIYKKHGLYFDKVISIDFPETKAGKEQMNAGMQKLRSEPPKSLLNIPVTVIEDYSLSTRVFTESEKKEHLLLPKSDVLAFRLKDGGKIVVRPSGTEPKIKIYCSIIVKDFESVDAALEEAEKQSSDLINAIKKLFY